MKKSIVVLMLAMGVLPAMAQTTKGDTSKIKPPVKAAPIPYKADPNKIYQIGFTEEELISVLRSASYGILPFLKTTKTPADQIDNVQKYYEGINEKVAKQYQDQWKADRAKFVADSLKAIKKP